MSRRGLLALAFFGAAAGIGFRVWALLLPQGALDADEAVVGLMTHGIIPERARALSQPPAALAGEWERFKERWKGREPGTRPQR